jgi:hypothetical protein
MKKLKTTICYLCGKPLAAPINADHPVMRQLFAREIRRRYNTKLITFDVHKACNSGYKSDTAHSEPALVIAGRRCASIAR